MKAKGNVGWKKMKERRKRKLMKQRVAREERVVQDHLKAIRIEIQSARREMDRR